MRAAIYSLGLVFALFLFPLGVTIAADPIPSAHKEKGVVREHGPAIFSPAETRAGDWRLEIRTPKNQFKPGENIIVQVGFLNVADEARLFHVYNDDLRNVIIMLTGPDGKQPPWSPSFSKKRLGEMQAPGFGAKILCWRVDPNACLKLDFRLDEIYDLSQPGRYEVRAVHMLELLMQATVLRPFYLEGRLLDAPRLESKPFKFTVSSPKKQRTKSK